MTEGTLLLKYQKKWVALTHDRSKVLETANGLKELADKIKGLKEKDIIVSYVLPADSYYSPLCKR